MGKTGRGGKVLSPCSKEDLGPQGDPGEGRSPGGRAVGFDMRDEAVGWNNRQSG